MAEIIISIGAKIAEYLFDYTVRQALYVFRFNKLVGGLENEKEELESTLQSVKERAEDATKRTEEIVQPVKKWLSDVENILQEVQKLEERMEAEKRCFNVSFRYSLAKQMANKTQQMTELKSKSKFDQFSRPTELEGIKYFSSKDFMYFKSTEFAFNMVLKALKDNSSRIIGLHGMGGSGKTSLVKEVGKKVEELKLFDKVVMAVVSQPLNVRNIQGQIADQLGLRFKEETDLGRAQRLSKRFENERILIILDDVWEKLDFEDIGMTSRDTSKSPNVLLTTRLRRVCVFMDCQSIIELSLLSEEEAWALFKLHANIIDDCPKDLKEVARKVAQECKGLPIAIVTLGSTLKGKSFEDWELALWRLQESQPIDIEEGLRSPYACLELSYDNLRNQVAKSLFLLCSMFPEDFEINKEDLFRYGKGVVQDPSVTLGTMEKARREINAAVDILIDSCLLMTANEKGYVLMHDMVRDVALRIASKVGLATMVATRMDPRMLVEDDTLKDKARISLWELKNGQLSDQLNCPKLEILLHHSKDNTFQMPNAYLEGMKALKVFTFMGTTWSLKTWGPYLSLSMPQSIGSLTNLRALRFRGCKLGDISIVGNLKELEILDLRGSSFTELPQGIAALNKLKLLDLFECSIEENDPYQVIGKCGQLQELYIWIMKHYPLENVSLPRLRRYVIGHVNLHDPFKTGVPIAFTNYGTTRALWIRINTTSLSSSMQDLILGVVESLGLQQLEGFYKNIIPSMDPRGFNQLVDLALDSCSGIECLVDMNTNPHDHDDGKLFQKEETVVFSKLVTLRLKHMDNLEQVFRDPSSCCSLSKLQELQIEKCRRLYSISFPRNSNLCSLMFLTLDNCGMLGSSLFTRRIAQTLVLLKKLVISRCSKLKNIIAEDEEDQNNNNVDDVSNQGNKIELEIILPALTSLDLSYLPNLTEICPKHYLLKSPNMKKLFIRGNMGFPTASMRKMVMGSDMQQDHTSMERGREIFWVIGTNLNELCKQVPPPASQAFLNFEFLIFHSCRVEGIFQLEVVEGEVDSTSSSTTQPLAKPFHSNLIYLYLKQLEELRFIWNLNGPTQLLGLQKLEAVILDGCPKLKTVFSPSIVRCLPKLKRLNVRNCEGLEEIISLDSEDIVEQKCPKSNCPNDQVCFPELNILDVDRCNKLKCLFSDSMACHFPQLISLGISLCSQLEQVFCFKGADADEDGKKRVVLPKLSDLTLIQLPSFTEICPGFEFQLDKCFVNLCPKCTYNSSTST